MKTCFPTLLLSCFMLAAAATAQQAEPSTDASVAEATVADTEMSEQQDLEKLRQLREALTEAVIAGDVEKQIEYVHSDVVTIWQNNQVARGHDGLREFLSDISPGGENIFQGYSERPNSDEVRILPGGNAAIAYGTSTPHYKWLGLEFDLQNRWTATLLKSDGQWKMVSYHVSGNLVDNPLLAAAKNSTYWAAAVTLLIGIVIGAVGAKLLQKKNPPAA